MIKPGFPEKQGLYDPFLEHDSCGVGFLCNIKGVKTNYVVKRGIDILKRLAHRGATGADPKTGDGAGILIQMPHEFFMKVCAKKKIQLPEPGEYGTGLVFMPRAIKDHKFCKETFERIIQEEGCTLLGWRTVPVDKSTIGKTAKLTAPRFEQVFVEKSTAFKDIPAFERKLYIIRRRVENEVKAAGITKTWFYITNLSCRTFSYKGLLMPEQIDKFFLDLKDASVKSAICLVHSRYSTNTFPTWDLAQPFRFLAHNGEINTLRGNINWMKARESLLESELFGNDIEKIKPIIIEGGSDSAMLDNMFELLALSGRQTQQAIMMLIPAAWEHNDLLDANLISYYKYNACLTEPWDGPAAVAFTDGTKVGAVLDRNGLRPARYIITKDDYVIMASEVGVYDAEAGNIEKSGRLEPGKIFFIDTELGKIVNDSEIKKEMAAKEPYADWIKKEMVPLKDLPEVPAKDHGGEDTMTLMKAFGYTREDLKDIFKPMADEAKDPTGAMGNDTPPAVISKNPQMLYLYFKQLFAQVTNPPIDSIREKVVMSLEAYIGQQKNILMDGTSHCHKLEIKTPVLKNSELEKIREINTRGFKTKTISLLYNAGDKNDFLSGLDRICKEAEDAINEGYSFIILTSRGINKEKASLPELLGLGAVHQYLIKKELRTRIGIILESAEAREIHHFNTLLGFGADGINPYLSFDIIRYMIKDGDIKAAHEKAETNYIDTVNKGILKIMSKMGISAVPSYKGAQIFEAIGLASEVIDKCFTGTVSRIGGSGFNELFEENRLRHKAAFPENGQPEGILRTGGIYQWRKDGEFHLWNPESIAAVQDAARNNNEECYRQFASLINDQSKNPTTLRGLMKFKKAKSIPIEKVEPIEKIFKRFVIGAMSFGAISGGAHETMAIAMNRIKAQSNTGEGGEDPTRFTPMANGDSKRSAVKQVASGRFGVTTNYLVNADEIQIKIAQGAKPGEGGQLPGHKVSEIIAKTRYTTPGVTLISPPPHHDIYSIEDLAQLIFDLKNTNPRARISVKLVSEIGVGTIAAGVAKGHADMILISGGDGGTGASPKASIMHAGLPWELGISETHQTLVLNDLRSRVRLQVDGQMRTGRDIAVAACLGAEEYGFGTAGLVIMGCVMLRHCNLNNCALGIATQDDVLQKRFKGRAEHLINYFTFVAKETREIMAQLGVRSIDELIGRVDLLEMDKAIIPWKAHNLDYSKILYKPKMPATVKTHCTIKQNHNIDKVLDRKLIKLAAPALKSGRNVSANIEIHNTDRTTGAMLSGEVCRIYGEQALPEDTINFKFKGVAGQSFGAFLAKGVTFELEGMSNDYVGKGISGGKIIIYPDKNAAYKPEENIIIGNTTFYGAICGEAYIRGIAGERFCIRNSGLLGVVEGTGDHGCEYMTGGRIVVIGPTGRNFAAGMSGGIAYVYDINDDFRKKCNMDMAEFEEISKEDSAAVNNLLFNHHKYTGSPIAKSILDNFTESLKKFIKVIPTEYKNILKLREQKTQKDLEDEADG